MWFSILLIPFSLRLFWALSPSLVSSQCDNDTLSTNLYLLIKFEFIEIRVYKNQLDSSIKMHTDKLNIEMNVVFMCTRQLQICCWNICKNSEGICEGTAICLSVAICWLFEVERTKVKCVLYQLSQNNIAKYTKLSCYYIDICCFLLKIMFYCKYQITTGKSSRLLNRITKRFTHLAIISEHFSLRLLFSCCKI